MGLFKIQLELIIESNAKGKNMKQEYKIYPKFKLRHIMLAVFAGIGIYAWVYYKTLSQGLDISFWEFVQKTYLVVLILVVVGFSRFRHRGILSVTQEYLKYGRQKYEWSNIKGVRWAQVLFEPGASESERVLMIELRKMSEDEVPVSEYLENVECLSPMNPKHTIELVLLNFSNNDIKTLEMKLHFHTNVHPEIKRVFKAKSY